MITDEEFDSLDHMVERHMDGVSPVQEVQVALLWAILKELRSSREINQQLARQFETVSSGGWAMTVVGPQ